MNNDDDEIFRRAMTGTKPIKVDSRAEAPARRPPAKARFRDADDKAALAESLHADIDDIEESSGEQLRFRRPTVGRRTMRKLARGNFAVQAEIDLHGMTVNEARPRLAEFIEQSSRSGKLCVRIVHGKGLGSGERGPVLKPSVNRWLRRWDRVLAFVSARQVDGGTGAVYVLLKDS
ncbi:MAG: Smr/MutS family protein [Gammaproteobacteria bacterium]|nr:Smr/MutS family protein [Gammaproteobacteria bacterium]NNC77862.1 DNA mismatch repair protein MutS [Woeseiaceae bacterium]